MNFFSHCPFSFKLNSCRTLLYRAFALSSNWSKFHEELTFLKSYFNKNCYPSFLFNNAIRKFLDGIFKPSVPVYDVPKMQMYVSLPFMYNSSNVKRELTKILSHLYPYVNFNFVFKNPLTIGSLFKFKDTLPQLMRSSTVYLYSCPRCNLGKYIGNSSRLLKVRIDCHMGISYRTGCTLSKKEFSAIRNHSVSCKHEIQYDDFKVLAQSHNSHSLPFLESLYVKHLSPNLNNTTTSVPLHIG